MTWRDKLARLIHGESETSPREVVPELQKAHASLARQAEQLRRHAAISPNQLNLQQLTELAEDEQSQAQLLVETLAGHGATPDGEGISATAEEALNHWGRLVEDLEAHHATVRHLRDQAIYFSGTRPAIAKLFGDLAHREELHAHRLRDLIARADPQARN